LQTEPVKPPPSKKLRPGALLISGVINVGGALLVLFAMPGTTANARMTSAWVLMQFLSGVWAGVFGANSPFLHGLVAGLPALALGLLVDSRLETAFVVMSYAVAPVAALLAAALMGVLSRR
jgi:hypothetical protein